MASLLVVVAWIAALALLTRAPRAEVRSRNLQLLKALFPSWRFFEDIGEVAVLRVRAGDLPDDLGPWRPALPRIPRRWRALLLHPEGNHLHATESLLQLLLVEVGEVGELGEHDEEALAASTSYRLVEEVVREQLRVAAPGAPLHYQFKLCTRDPAGVEEDVLLSPVREM